MNLDVLPLEVKWKILDHIDLSYFVPKCLPWLARDDPGYVIRRGKKYHDLRNHTCRQTVDVLKTIHRVEESEKPPKFFELSPEAGDHITTRLAKDLMTGDRSRIYTKVILHTDFVWRSLLKVPQRALSHAVHRMQKDMIYVLNTMKINYERRFYMYKFFTRIIFLMPNDERREIIHRRLFTAFS